MNEKKACRFAAELLLPEEALYREIQNYRRIYNKSKKEMEQILIEQRNIRLIYIKEQIGLVLRMNSPVIYFKI